MNARFVPVLSTLWLASCAPQTQQPVQTAGAPPPAAVPAPPPSTPAPSEAQIVPGLWEVERVRCSDLLGAADDDRAAAAMLSGRQSPDTRNRRRQDRRQCRQGNEAMRRDPEHYGAASIPRGAPATPFARLICRNRGISRPL